MSFSVEQWTPFLVPFLGALAGLMVIVSAISSALSGRKEVQAEWSRIKEKEQALKEQEEKLNRRQEAERHLEARIGDLAQYLRRIQSSKLRANVSSNSPAFGQYIVGGILATSFVQENMAEVVVSFLGVLVLVSALIREQFKPDQQKAIASKVELVLKEQQRSVEDQYANLKVLSVDEKMLLKFSQKVSRILNNVEKIEHGLLSELNSTKSPVSAAPSRGTHSTPMQQTNRGGG